MRVSAESAGGRLVPGRGELLAFISLFGRAGLLEWEEMEDCAEETAERREEGWLARVEGLKRVQREHRKNNC